MARTTYNLPKLQNAPVQFGVHLISMLNIKVLGLVDRLPVMVNV